MELEIFFRTQTTASKKALYTAPNSLMELEVKKRVENDVSAFMPNAMRSRHE